MASGRSWSGIVAAAVVAASLASPGVAGAAAAPARDITKFACPDDLDSAFTDVEGTTHEVAIECLFEFGVANGTSPTTFSPSGNVTRGQLATLIARALSLAGAPLDPAAAGFTDLGGTVHTDAINALANLGIITGKTPTTFAPDALATRAQTASIVGRSIPGGLPENPPDAFVDDEGATAHEAFINQLAAVGIISGITADRFDPDASLSRGAAASVVARGFDFAVEHGFAAPVVAEDDLSAALRGQEEAPGPGDDDAFGSVQLLVGGLPGLLCVQWDIDGPLSSDPNAAHVHIGPAGVPGPVVLTLPTPDVIAGERLFSRACISDQDQGVIDAMVANPANHYVNVHTATFPDGAIRGQLTVFETPLGTVLTGAEVAPGPGEANAGGDAFVDTMSDGETICSFLIYDGAGVPAAAHIHAAAPGAAGPTVVTLPPFDIDGPVSDGCVGGLDPALVADIAANPANYYVNVHTDGFPDGAVRGQLELSAFLGASLTGAAEVPGPGDDDGDGFAFIDLLGDGRMCVHISVRRLDRVTAAHIHEAAAGAAGPVVVTLAPPLFGSSDACVDVDPALFDDLVANPADYYVDVHTQPFPDGAVRGQLQVLPG
jgi:hypothetical protein